ncbi:MAG TPA: methyltransferase domain-containing protein [Candidatus Brocadiaceae bacterium]
MGNIFQCRRCGLIYRDPHPRIEALLRPQSQIKKRSDNPDKLSQGRISLFNNHIKSISHFRYYNRILDVGSGEGYFLNLCSLNGWGVWGVEIVPELVESSKKEYRINVFNGNLEAAKYPDNYFDVVVFLNVLEHLLNPYSALSEAYRILRPGGAILLRFPNAAFHIPSRWFFTKLFSLWKGVMRFNQSVIHLYAFNRSTVCRYLNVTGFRTPIFENTSVACSSAIAQGNGIKRMLIHIAEGVVKFIKVISLGRLLIGPSLSLIAVKPLR